MNHIDYFLLILLKFKKVIFYYKNDIFTIKIIKIY